MTNRLKMWLYKTKIDSWYKVGWAGSHELNSLQYYSLSDASILEMDETREAIEMRSRNLTSQNHYVDYMADYENWTQSIQNEA